MNKYLFLLTTVGLGLAACTNETLLSEDNLENGGSNQNSSISNVKTARLTSIASSQNRINVLPSTKVYPNPGELTLYAEIANPSSEISNFNREGRDMSATCVYYDQANDLFYVTYHMQGNNYNTNQTVETKGFIETFSITENKDDEGNPFTLDLKNIYTSAESDIDFDFNHLFFDDLSNTNLNGYYSGPDSGVRIIAAGHSSSPVKDGNGYNTKAIIAKLNLDENKIEYSTVLTGDKLYDDDVLKADGTPMPLGDEDAGDVNCVIRKYNYYYLATRKGIAALNATPDNLFTPVMDYEKVVENNGEEKWQKTENSIYFIKTPGSAKHMADYYPAYGSGFSFLYLSEPTDKNFDGNTASPARLINFSMEAGGGTLCGMNTTDSQTNGKSILTSKDFDITNWSLGSNQFEIPDYVCPIDGKNVIFNLNGRLYACLGKGGLYVRKSLSTIDGPTLVENTITFSDKKEGGSRPVNGVYVEDVENFNDGFIYVANGACLTILDRETLEKVAEYSAFDASDDVNNASANYVHVVRSSESSNGKCPDRLITVAYGQAGVKIFKFIPPTR